MNEIRDLNRYRAACDTAGITALNAAFGFSNGLFFSETNSDLIKIVCAVVNRQFWHYLTLLFKNCDRFEQFNFVEDINLGIEPALFVIFIGAGALDNAGEINQVTVEFRPVHAGELHFIAYLYAAAAAHPGAVHHDGVQADGSGNRVVAG